MHKGFRITIPKEYKNEFTLSRIKFISSRVRLFVLLTVGIYFLVTLADLLIFKSTDFKPEEFYVWALLIAGSAIIWFLNTRAKTLVAAKLTAYAFTAFILVILTKLCIIYADYAGLSYSLYVFTLFLVSVVMPLTALDVISVSALHLLAYAFYFAYLAYWHPELVRTPFTAREFIDGNMFLAMASLLCAVIRYKESRRDAENFVLLKLVESKNAQMEAELAFARKIHQTLIPKSISTDVADIAVMCLPASQIGGDYTRFHFVAGERLVFIISDITGHGVPAALLVNRLHTEFERLAKDGRRPGALLKELDSFIREDFEDTNMLLSAFCGMLDFRTGRLYYSSYGHPEQYIYRITSSAVEALGSLTMLLGVPSRDDRIYEHEMTFEPGDMIFLFTDGVIEAANAKGEEYGKDRVERFMSDHQRLSVNDFNQKLLEEIGEYKSGDFKDDISMLAIRIKKQDY